MLYAAFIPNIEQRRAFPFRMRIDCHLSLRTKPSKRSSLNAINVDQQTIITYINEKTKQTQRRSLTWDLFGSYYFPTVLFVLDRTGRWNRARNHSSGKVKLSRFR